MLSTLHKTTSINSNFEFKEGGLNVLCSNNDGTSPPSLELEIGADANQSELIRRLAEILLEGFFKSLDHQYNDSPQGSNLLPSINKRTSRRREQPEDTGAYLL